MPETDPMETAAEKDLWQRLADAACDRQQDDRELSALLIEARTALVTEAWRRGRRGPIETMSPGGERHAEADVERDLSRLHMLLSRLATAAGRTDGRADTLMLIGMVQARVDYFGHTVAALRQQQADAERWRAFIGSSRIRFFGTAGPDVHNYAHFGGEFWTGVPADKYDEQTHESTRANAEWLVKYADAARLASSSEPPPTTET